MGALRCSLPTSRPLRALLAAAGLAFVLPLDAATYELQSGAWDTGSAVGGRSVALSSNGRYVVFASESARIVEGDTNGKADIFLRDRATGRTSRISVSSSGGQANGPSPSLGSVTPDGRYVSFYSTASNLVAGDTNATGDVFVRDTVAGTTERVSVSSASVQGNDNSWSSFLSDDGRYVLFFSSADNLLAGQTRAPATYMRDRLNRTTTLVSLADPTAWCWAGALSADGHLAAFQCSGEEDRIYVRNLIDRSLDPVTFPQTSENLVTIGDMSADGRFLTFTSYEPVVAADIDGWNDAYLYDRTTRVFELLSVGYTSSVAGGVSDDGRYVAFIDDGLSLTWGGYVRDRSTKTTVRLSSTTIPWLTERPFELSSDGQTALFTSEFALVANDANAKDDVFIATNLFAASGSLTVQPRSLFFGAVPVGTTSATKTLTVTNTGTVSLALPWVNLRGYDGAEFVRERHCPNPLPAGASCTIDVGFVPASAGAKQARIVISTGPDGIRIKVPLRATGQ